MRDRSAQFRIGQLAARTGVEPDRLRKWEARYALLQPERSAGGFRLYSREDERRVRLMQRHLARGYAAAEAAELARQGIVSPAPARLGTRLTGPVIARSHGLLRDALADYDEGAAQRALDDLFAAFSVEAVLRDAVLPFMREVGNDWEDGHLAPSQEHFLSAIVEGRLMALARGWGSGSGRRALLACPAGEAHTIGLIAFGIALSQRGWRITYLGADTPGESVAVAAERTSPGLIVLSSVRAECFTDAANELGALGAERPLLLGGAGATRAVASQLRAKLLATDPVSAAAQIGSRSAEAAA